MHGRPRARGRARARGGARARARTRARAKARWGGRARRCGRPTATVTRTTTTAGTVARWRIVDQPNLPRGALRDPRPFGAAGYGDPSGASVFGLSFLPVLRLVPLVPSRSVPCLLPLLSRPSVSAIDGSKIAPVKRTSSLLFLAAISFRKPLFILRRVGSKALARTPILTGWRLLAKTIGPARLAAVAPSIATHSRSTREPAPLQKRGHALKEVDPGIQLDENC